VPKPPPAPAPAVPPPTPDIWDERIADGLAFLRRRLTGSYEVDEFGFDPDLTDTLVYPMLRLMYQKYFGSSASAWRTCRWTARPSSWPTTPARCRWTP
jgi:hypothetical protein